MTAVPVCEAGAGAGGRQLGWVLSVLLVILSMDRCPLLGQQPAEPPGASEETETGLVLQRRIQIPQGEAVPAIVMTGFFTQGELAPDGGNLAVRDGRNSPLPWRILQHGPGDFCRIAFQTDPRQHAYRIFYGGKASPRKPPAWKSTTGLLLETRHGKPFNLNAINAWRETWTSARPYGMAYVPAVFHRFNPIWPEPEPFLSMYRGTLRITRSGLHRFFTSSQDCSFLLVDGKVIVEAPGSHGPIPDARIKGEVNLSAGTHDFEYLHAAAGADACMVAAWQPPGFDKPELIPTAAFGTETIADIPTIPVKSPRDYLVEIGGEVPLAGSPLPLVRAQFRVVSRSGSTRPRLRWDFGDGQTSTAAEPVHIYLAPGEYRVSLWAAGESEAQAVVNRVPIHRALVFVDEKHPADQLAQYLTILDGYEAGALDWQPLLQLVRAFDQAGRFAAAAKTGQAGMQVERAPTDAESALELARLVGTLLRDQNKDPKGAVSFWERAVNVLRVEAWKAELEIAAADVTLNELLQAEAAKRLLDSAAARLGQRGDTALVSRLNRVLGDWNARKGDRAAALAAYARASAVLDGRKSAVEQDARRGAFSRSTEEFLRAGNLDRARDALRTWEAEFPADRIDGDGGLLQVRYWAARAQWAQASALAGDLVGLNPDSPYADQLVCLAAESEEKRGHADRALAGFQSLLTDYPGSPLVPAARKKIASLSTKPSTEKRP